MPRCAAIGLCKCLKNERVFLDRYADSRIGHAEMQTELTVGAGIHLHLEDDFSLGCELDGVSHEVHEHLAKPPGIANNLLRYLRVDVEGEFESLLMGSRSHPSQRFPHHVLQIEFNRVEVQLSRLHFGKIEN